MSSSLIERQAACTATAEKYRNRPFDWSEGVSCIHMARFHLRHLGHNVPSLSNVRSPVSVNRELKKNGWSTVSDVLDAQPGLLRIAPAQMLIGDIAVVPSEDRMGAILICAGAGKFFGWHDTAEELGVKGMAVISVPLSDLDGAWRV